MQSCADVAWLGAIEKGGMDTFSAYLFPKSDLVDFTGDAAFSDFSVTRPVKQIQKGHISGLKILLQDKFCGKH